MNPAPAPAPAPAFGLLTRPSLARNVPAPSPSAPPVLTWKARNLLPRIGAVPVLVSAGLGWDDVRAYAVRIDDAAESLDADSTAQIVYADPVAVAAAAKGSGGSVLSDPSADFAKEAAKLAARAKARGPEATARDLEWSTRWAQFWKEWKAWFATVTGPPGLAPSGSASWERNQFFERRLRELAALYQALPGTKVSQPLPESLEASTGKKDDEAKGLGDQVAGAAKTVALGLVAVGGLYVVGRVVTR